MNLSLERPLLEETERSSNSSEDLEYEIKSVCHNGQPNGRRCLIPLLTLAIGAGLLILGLQTILIWNLWRQHHHLELLGEINGLVPPSKYCESDRAE